ncbi:unnamed protein product [Cyprideis torosa]|uniref:Uncharacterized protein n=1 Tax=Cyprideis torosa TaxID=163714 RepID=A0A7R8ZL27_9CRUS|nr:unnamed protein product [Cyprideis torosa]CAG0885706.1 unnamed protein product [Cyprideis torosa]
MGKKKVKKKAVSSTSSEKIPEKTTTKLKWSLEDLLKKTEELVDNFDFDLAKTFCERAMEMSPENTKVLELLASIDIERRPVAKTLQLRHQVFVHLDFEVGTCWLGAEASGDSEAPGSIPAETGILPHQRLLRETQVTFNAWAIHPDLVGPESRAVRWRGDPVQGSSGVPPPRKGREDRSRPVPGGLIPTPNHKGPLTAQGMALEDSRGASILWLGNDRLHDGPLHKAAVLTSQWFLTYRRPDFQCEGGPCRLGKGRCLLPPRRGSLARGACSARTLPPLGLLARGSVAGILCNLSSPLGGTAVVGLLSAGERFLPSPLSALWALVRGSVSDFLLSPSSTPIRWTGDRLLWPDPGGPASSPSPETTSDGGGHPRCLVGSTGLDWGGGQLASRPLGLGARRSRRLSSRGHRQASRGRRRPRQGKEPWRSRHPRGRRRHHRRPSLRDRSGGSCCRSRVSPGSFSFPATQPPPSVPLPLLLPSPLPQLLLCGGHVLSSAGVKPGPCEGNSQERATLLAAPQAPLTPAPTFRITPVLGRPYPPLAPLTELRIATRGSPFLDVGMGEARTVRGQFTREGYPAGRATDAPHSGPDLSHHPSAKPSLPPFGAPHRTQDCYSGLGTEACPPVDLGGKDVSLSKDSVQRRDRINGQDWIRNRFRRTTGPIPRRRKGNLPAGTRARGLELLRRCFFGQSSVLPRDPRELSIPDRRGAGKAICPPELGPEALSCCIVATDLPSSSMVSQLEGRNRNNSSMSCSSSNGSGKGSVGRIHESKDSDTMGEMVRGWGGEPWRTGGGVHLATSLRNGSPPSWFGDGGGGGVITILSEVLRLIPRPPTARTPSEGPPPNPFPPTHAPPTHSLPPPSGDD